MKGDKPAGMSGLSGSCMVKVIQSRLTSSVRGPSCLKKSCDGTAAVSRGPYISGVMLSWPASGNDIELTGMRIGN